MPDPQTCNNPLIQEFDDNLGSPSTINLSDTITNQEITWANWENLLEYIKLNLGATVNQFEFTDEEMIDIIKEHVLPEFSRYVPYIKYHLLYENGPELIQKYPFYVYRFLNITHKILRIHKLIRKPNLLDLSQYYNIQQNGGDITNYLITMNTVQMANDVIPPDTWRFISPDKMELIKGANNYGVSMDFIVELECVHNDPSTIDPDQYRLLKDFALANIMIYIGRIRTKFSQFNTPQAQVEVLASELLQEGQQLKEKIQQELDDLTPDHMLWFLN